eukprot:798560_1
MANNQQTRKWESKFRSLQSMGKNFQSSMKQTMNGFTGIDKPTTHSTYDNNNTKSISGARQYQSARRASIDRNIHSNQHSNQQSNKHSNQHSIQNNNNSHSPKYQKRRKRSLLIGRESYTQQINNTHINQTKNTQHQSSP